MRRVEVRATREADGVRIRIQRNPYHRFDRALSTHVLSQDEARALLSELAAALEVVPAPEPAE